MDRYYAEQPTPAWIEYYFVNWVQRSIPHRHLLSAPRRYKILFGRKFRQKDQNLASGLVYSFDYYLENSQADWFYRGTDDTFLVMRNLPDYIGELNRKYDARTDRVVFGNCLNMDASINKKYRLIKERWIFLQGGAGFLMSRAAVEAGRKVLNEAWVRNISRPEDYLVSRILFQVLGFSSWQATSPYFLGMSFPEKQVELILSNSVEKLPPCPKPSDKSCPGCRGFVAPVKWLVAFHGHGSEADLSQIESLLGKLLDQPVNVMWWMKEYDPMLCYGKKIPMREY
jgi:hypothetical protein